ncbi:putative UPD-GlcNAc transporter (Mnn2-2) [Aspergillus lentulus]|uniref:putative UPD-GlcNAc transporter (Mnn2-2) n=1 Tax=Aspergillus lentulus TaxID=293939 RepID=UPI0013947038|nr:putative UPD-GlcNAc transporter (Mnn2-2) [Aspergillus lentulus]GFF56724.1 putative UPD-GlcNAc transporter (Mnn2-2) [Aspergillus lentulus]
MINHNSDDADTNKSDAKEKHGDVLKSDGLGSIATAAAYATSPKWISMVLMVSLIFGGCCANVFALEAIVKDQPSSGPLITFAQFIVTAGFTLPNFVSLSCGARSLFLSPRVIPLRSWLVYTAYFVTVNLLNNWAFAYSISVPLHIILRSGGPVASLIVGYLFNGKKYSYGQILAVAVLTLGVVTAALADAQAKGEPLDIGHGGADLGITATATGFAILASAMVLSAFQGIYADRLYETYGRSHWKEALFYSHVLSLPLFLPTYPRLLDQWRVMLSSPPLRCRFPETSISVGKDAELPSGPSTTSIAVCGPRLDLGILRSHLFPSFIAHIPMQVAYLFVNALTQYLCIRGVHLLSAQTSSLTVTVILNVRKLVSLLLSIYLFGNQLSPGVVIGAICVFAGGGLYGLEGARLRKPSNKKD